MAEISISVDITGDTDLAGAIDNVFSTMRTELIGPLVEEAEEIMAASKEIVPVDQGILRDSGDAVGITPSDESDGVFVRFGYGGAARSYALVQHETPPSVFSHAEGQTWKYLERPVYEAATTMGQRLAARIAARFSAGIGGPGAGSGETFGGG